MNVLRVWVLTPIQQSHDNKDKTNTIIIKIENDVVL